MMETGRSPIVEKILQSELAKEQREPEEGEQQQPAEQPAAEGTAESPAAPAEVAPPAEEAEEPVVDFQAYMEATEQQFKKGQLVTGTVVSMDSTGVLVDIGAKSEGLIPPHEISPDDEINVGDTVEAILLKPATEDEYSLLSKRRADYEKMWRVIQENYQHRNTVEVLVKDRVKGGLIVDVGLEGFVPASHVVGGQRDLERLVGKMIPVRIIEVDRKRNKIICSHRTAVEEDRTQRRAETLATLEEGKIVEGIVRRITDFGAFVDLGGIDGLLHVREMSWTRVNHPSDVVKKGQRIQIVVLEMNTSNPGNERISLGLKQLLPDPWKKATKNLRIGQVVHGKVTRLAPQSVFVLLDAGIEGIVPLHELAEQRVHSPEEVVKVGDEVDVKVIQIKSSQRRLTLSLRQAVQQHQQRRERDEYRSFVQSQKSDNVTLGDVFGEKLANRFSQSAAAEAPEGAAEDNSRKAPEPPAEEA